jgi:hypothetical protein
MLLLETAIMLQLTPQGGLLARKLTRQEARQMAAARKSFGGGRPVKSAPCLRCGTPCDSAIQAAAHCVGPVRRDREAAERARTAAAKYSPETFKQQYPRWKYHASGKAVIVNDPEAESALGEGWADTPAAFEK